TPGAVELRTSPPGPDQERVRVGEELRGGDHSEGLWPRIDRGDREGDAQVAELHGVSGKGPGTRWAQRFKPVSSGAIPAVPLGLPRGDHFLEQDAAHDRRCGTVAACVWDEPPLPLEPVKPPP